MNIKEYIIDKIIFIAILVIGSIFMIPIIYFDVMITTENNILNAILFYIYVLIYSLISSFYIYVLFKLSLFVYSKINNYWFKLSIFEVQNSSNKNIEKIDYTKMGGIFIGFLVITFICVIFSLIYLDISSDEKTSIHPIVNILYIILSNVDTINPLSFIIEEYIVQYDEKEYIIQDNREQYIFPNDAREYQYERMRNTYAIIFYVPIFYGTVLMSYVFTHIQLKIRNKYL